MLASILCLNCQWLNPKPTLSKTLLAASISTAFHIASRPHQRIYFGKIQLRGRIEHTCKLDNPEPVIDLHPIRDSSCNCERPCIDSNPASVMLCAKLMVSLCKAVSPLMQLMPSSVILGAPCDVTNLPQ